MYIYVYMYGLRAWLSVGLLNLKLIGFVYWALQRDFEKALLWLFGLVLRTLDFYTFVDIGFWGVFLGFSK